MSKSLLGKYVIFLAWHEIITLKGKGSRGKQIAFSKFMKQLIFLTFSYLTVCFYTENTVLSEEQLPISLCFKSYPTWAPGHEYPFPRVYKLGFRVGSCKCHPRTWGL